MTGVISSLLPHIRYLCSSMAHNAPITEKMHVFYENENYKMYPAIIVLAAFTAEVIR